MGKMWRKAHSYLLHVIEFWAESAMHAEDLLLYDCSYRQAVEAVCEGFPQLDVVPPLACSNSTRS